MYDLVVKGGKVIDPAQEIHECMDIAISEGKISALARQIPDNEAKNIIDARGKIVAPGLIDLHQHVSDAIIPLGTSPDAAGVSRGVTTVCDAGSTGYANFLGFKKYVISHAQTDVFCYLNICPTGLALMPEIRTWDDMDAEATLKTAMENRNIVKGIKIRAVGSIAENLGIEAIKVAKKVAEEADIPLMVHMGDGMTRTAMDIMDAFSLEVLNLLDAGDIISHIYTGWPGSVIKPDGTVPHELKEAIERGVITDTAHGIPNLSFIIAKQGIAQGILPTTISTDLASTNINGPIFSLLLTMSKFLALGLSLNQVIEMTTINPARALRESPLRGTLNINTPADISILELTEGNFTFLDGWIGNKIEGELLLLPHLTLKAGVEIIPRPGSKDEIG